MDFLFGNLIGGTIIGLHSLDSSCFDRFVDCSLGSVHTVRELLNREQFWFLNFHLNRFSGSGTCPRIERKPLLAYPGEVFRSSFPLGVFAVEIFLHRPAPGCQPWYQLRKLPGKRGCSFALPGARAMEHPARPKAGLSLARQGGHSAKESALVRAFPLPHETTGFPCRSASPPFQHPRARQSP